MRERGRKRTETRANDAAAATTEATPSRRPDPGPRPLSPRQRAEREAQTTAAPLDWRAPSPSRRRIRDAGASRVTVRLRRGNRKRVNYPRLLLQWASAVFLVQIVVTLLFSPRFYVREVAVTGSATVPAERLKGHLALGPSQNILRMPVKRLERLILNAEPALDNVKIRRSLPATVHLVVTERVPWAAVKVTNGECYTIDDKLVPFRKTGVPEQSLPLLTLSMAKAGQRPAIKLGKQMSAPGLSEVSKCLQWASERRDFPIEAIEIDPEGKLCLNRVGGMRVLLGAGIDLEKKLASLGMLLGRHPGLQEGVQVAYVNLFAHDAPAVMPLPPDGGEGEDTPPSLPRPSAATNVP